MPHRQLSSRIAFALSLVWRAAPGWTTANVALVAVQGMLPLPWLYALRRHALFRPASVLILDEPLAHLDPDAQPDLLRRFRQLAAGKAVLLVSHYLAAVAVADRVYEMDAGRIVRQSRGDEFLAAHWPLELERGA